ncbi:hypothetical protein BCR36DRAFT_375672 [Piromyces finnis]|nr:hypothetical protein BCR36DRAFT_375672 [Piromyces finnis]|eukprot:ORX38093.1 hypothetical protein BCR36DRAFT_375672 [Piromyces finnis]
MLRLLYITLFIIIASNVNAEHLDAFLYKDNWRDHRLKTDNNKDMYNMKKGDTIYYYYKSGLREPSCSINISNNEIDNPGVGNYKGDEYNDKICIESYSTLFYFKIHDNKSNASEKCEWTSYEVPNERIIDTTASCNNYGC